MMVTFLWSFKEAFCMLITFTLRGGLHQFGRCGILLGVLRVFMAGLLSHISWSWQRRLDTHISDANVDFEG